MKKIIIKDSNHPAEDSTMAKTGIILFKNKRRMDSIKFIDNLQFPDAISLFANGLAFMMKTYEKVGMPKDVIYNNFKQAMDLAFEKFNPELTKAKLQEHIDNFAKQVYQPPKNMPKNAYDPYNQ